MSGTSKEYAELKKELRLQVGPQGRQLRMTEGACTSTATEGLRR